MLSVHVLWHVLCVWLVSSREIEDGRIIIFVNEITALLSGPSRGLDRLAM